MSHEEAKGFVLPCVFINPLGDKNYTYIFFYFCLSSPFFSFLRLHYFFKCRQLFGTDDIIALKSFRVGATLPSGNVEIIG